MNYEGLFTLVIDSHTILELSITKQLVLTRAINLLFVYEKQYTKKKYLIVMLLVNILNS